MLLALLSLLVLALVASASPMEPTLLRRLSTQAVTPLSALQRGELRTFAEFAKASYCSSGSVTNWTCGPACDASSGVTHIDSDGDDQLIPGWFVVYSALLDATIVAHQGTNTKSLVSIVEDLATTPVPLNPLLFPGTAARGMLAHGGFALTQSLTAQRILAAVKLGATRFGTKNVVTIGHSLGAAIATLDSLYLQIQLPSMVVRNRVFASPRVGNHAFATYFPAVVPDSIHMNNKNDPVPHLPPILLGFEHIPGEVYINPFGSVDACPGTENFNCILGAPPSKWDEHDHGGPYEGVTIGGCLV